MVCASAGEDPNDTINLLIRTMNFFSSKKPIQKQVSLSQLKGVTVDPKLIENIEINDGSMLQEAVAGKSLATQGVSALEITPTNHSNRIRESAAGATGVDENPDFSTMTREEKREYAQKVVDEIFEDIDSPLLDPDEPAVDPAEEDGGDGPKPVDEEIDGGKGGGNADSEDSGGSFWDWVKSLFSDDEEDGNDADGNDTGTGVDQSSDNPMNDHQGGGEPDDDSALQDIDADINHGPDGKNDSSGESDFDSLDPITNWGPNGKPSVDGAGIDIGIDLDDPNTNWDGGNHGGQHIDSPLIDVLGDVNPEFNASEDIGTDFVQLMAPSGNNFF